MAEQVIEMGNLNNVHVTNLQLVCNFDKIKKDLSYICFFIFFFLHTKGYRHQVHKHKA